MSPNAVTDPAATYVIAAADVASGPNAAVLVAPPLMSVAAAAVPNGPNAPAACPRTRPAAAELVASDAKPLLLFAATGTRDVASDAKGPNAPAAMAEIVEPTPLADPSAPKPTPLAALIVLFDSDRVANGPNDVADSMPLPTATND
jgi:hypothetical protein